MEKSECTYDGLSRLETLTNYKGTTVLSSYSYTYDNNGNILTVNETVEGIEQETNFTYDKLNRIATVSGTKGADSYYEYDERGNRKASYEQIDFLSEENVEYIYTEENKLFYAETDDNATQFDYNADGYRFVKNSSSSNLPLFYIYDEAGRLMSEVLVVVGDNQLMMHPVRQYIWGPDRVLAQRDIYGNCYYYLYNGHGDVVQIVDTNGNIKNSYDYDVWGNFLKKEETIDNPFTYFGQTYDEETGLYYLRARYYDPTTGRFTQQDPAEDGYNWYVYGNQNPVMYIDENGESAALAIPWVRQQVIWKNGVRGLNIAGLPVSAQMLDHSIRWFSASNVNITEKEVSGSERINKTDVINALKNSQRVSNKIDLLIESSNNSGINSFDWSDVLTLNDSTDLYLSFNNATVTLKGSKNKDGVWSVNVNVFDIYDFDIEALSDIKSFKSAIGSAAGTAAAFEQIPILGAIKTYSINVNFNVTR